MHAFARVESHINLELNNFVLIKIGLRQPGGDLIIDAILGAARIAVLMDTIKRLLRVTKASNATKEEMDSIFSHLGEINFLRDAIVHNAAYPAIYDGPGLHFTSNAYGVREAEKAMMIIFRLTDLQNLTRDLEVMQERISRCSLPERLRRSAFAGDEVSS